MCGVPHYPDMWTIGLDFEKGIHAAAVLKLNLPSQNSLGGTDLKNPMSSAMTTICKTSLSNLKHEVTVFLAYVSSPKPQNPHILKDQASDPPAPPVKHSSSNDQP